MWNQGLIQKEKVHSDCEKGAQISILAKKIATQWGPNVIIKESLNKLYIIFRYFLVFMFTSCCWFDQKTGIEFNGSFSFQFSVGRTQISVPKIGKPMLTTACINPWKYSVSNH